MATDNTFQNLQNSNPGKTVLPFQFTGSGKEFFGIWIVNVLLSIVTIGIYSAWAKVRTKTYFNGNTILDDHNFGYHADPVKILIGRIIVVVFLIVMNVISNFAVWAAIPVFLIYAIGIPWAIVRGLAFNAYVISYRNLRFRFLGNKMGAFRAFIVMPLVGILTAGILAPFVSRSMARYVSQHRYGQAPFVADPPIRGYRDALLGAILFILLAGGLLFLVGGIYAGLFPSLTGMEAVVTVVVSLAYLLLISAFVMYSVYSRNHTFAHLTLDGSHRFHSNMRFIPYMWILFSNLVLIVVTIGLFIPFAKVRVARYVAAHTYMIADGPLDGFVAGQTDDGNVAAGEFLDMEGFDFGF